MLRREPGAEVLDGSSILLDEMREMPARDEVGDMVREPLAKKIGQDAVADAGTTEDVIEHGCPPFGLRDRRKASGIIWTHSKGDRADRMRLVRDRDATQDCSKLPRSQRIFVRDPS
jgi:hypothetical protein